MLWVALIGRPFFCLFYFSEYFCSFIKNKYLSLKKNATMRNYSALSPEWKNKVVLKSIEYLTGHKAVKWHTEANRYAYKIESDLQYYFSQPGSGKVNGWRVVLQSDVDFVLKNHIGSILTQLDYKF